MYKVLVYLSDTCPAGDQMSAGVHNREEQCASQWIVFPFTLVFPKLIFYSKGLFLKGMSTSENIS